MSKDIKINEYNTAYKLLSKKHEGKWVAVSKDYKKVLAYSDNLKTLRAKVKDASAVYLRHNSPRLDYAFSL